MSKSTGHLTLLAALGSLGIAVGCASDGISPDPAERNLGILQMEGASALQATESGGPASGAGGVSVYPFGGSSISWDVPPSEGTLFPPEVILAPAAAIVGFPFPVTVFTVGPNGCWSPDGIEVASSGRVVDLVPWDLHSGADACTMIFGYLAHDTLVTLSEPGQWTLRVEGRRVRGDGTMDGSVRAERTILAYPPSDVPAPAQIQLSPGQEIVVDAVLRLRFAGIDGDSRCPSDAQCVWQGNAAVLLAFSIEGSPEESVVLNTGIESDDAAIGEYRIRLLALSPHPVSTEGIPAGAYRATLQIDPLITP